MEKPDKLTEKPCPFCRFDYRYVEPDGTTWCPHCGGIELTQEKSDS